MQEGTESYSHQATCCVVSSYNFSGPGPLVESVKLRKYVLHPAEVRVL